MGNDLTNYWLSLLRTSAGLLDVTTDKWMLRLFDFLGCGLCIDLRFDCSFLRLNSSIGLWLRDVGVVSLKVLALVKSARMAIATGSADTLLSICLGSITSSAKHSGSQSNGEFHVKDPVYFLLSNSPYFLFIRLTLNGFMFDFIVFHNNDFFDLAF